MQNKIINSENLPFIIIGIVTLILMGFGVLLLTSSAPKEVDTETIEKRIVREDSHKFGKLDSKIVFVEFSDFQCSHCADFQPTLNALKEKYADEVLFVYRHYPLNFGNPAVFPNGPIAADAAEAANAQGKFWEIQDYLFTKQTEWSTVSKTEAKDLMVKYAKDLKIEDLEKFEKEMRESKYIEIIEQDYDDGTAIGITGTPGLFLNSEPIQDRSFEGISASIDELLKNE